MSRRIGVEWLAARRWFGAADRSVRSLAVVEAAALAGQLEWQAVRVVFSDATEATYQVVWDPNEGDDAAAQPAAIRWLFPDLDVGRTRLLAGEQSNTSVVVEPAGPGDGPIIVKLFRRLEAQPNPDAEVVRALWDGGFRGVPEPLGECRRPLRCLGSAAPVDLAVARRFLDGSTDGWSLALAAAAGFEGPAAALGRLTGELHRALAATLGTSTLDHRAAAAAMAAHAAAVLGGEAPAATNDRFEQLAAAPAGPAIRTHGDYHLGQVLARDGQWYVLDFEGEPNRPMAERVAPASPLRDVAGMLRSFAYAAAVAGHGERWEVACRSAFVDAYLTTEGLTDLLPADPLVVLRAYELDKAIYEVGYERAHRPDWVAIPLAAVARLTASGDHAPGAL